MKEVVDIIERLTPTVINHIDTTLEAKCIQVDTEEKVIARLHRTSKLYGWRYPDDCSHTAKCGSGNNWANGFFIHAPRIRGELESLIQHQLERCDCLDGLLATMSLAGGTGSGVGTSLLLQLPDLLPKTPTLAQLIWPYWRGEVSVQAYNAVLTLGHLLSSATIGSLDGVVMHHNDVLHNICTNRLRATNPNSPIGLDQLNALAAHQLAGLLQPFSHNSGIGTTVCPRRLSALLARLCGHPDYRLLQLRCLPYFGPECRAFSTETWAQLARHGRQMLLTGSSSDDKLIWSSDSSGLEAVKRFRQSHLPILECVAVLRGQDADEHIQQPEAFLHDLTKNLIRPTRQSSLFSRHPIYSTFLGSHTRSFLGYPRSLFIATNGGGTQPTTAPNEPRSTAPKESIPAYLSHVTSRAWEMFASKAFFHQYERFGLTNDVFLDCFAAVEQIAHCYSTLAWD